MAEETYGWLFVDFVPLLYEKKRVAKQFQIETWLDLSQLAKELNIENVGVNKRSAPSMGYVV